MMDADNCTLLAKNPNVKIWQMTNKTEDNLITSYMEIKKITKNGTGLYRCGASATTVGHAISVSVTGKRSFYVFYCFGRVFAYIIYHVYFI